MKRSLLFNLLLAATLALGGAVGCKRKPKAPTVIPANASGRTGTGDGYGEQGVPPGQPVPVPPVVTGSGTDGDGEVPPLVSLDDMVPDPTFFAANTIYFDFDRSTIRAGDRSRLEEVGKYLLANPTHAVRIEGNCDERGTEGYNIALGERRALAAREYLLNMGVPADRITTISYGESRPAELGTGEAVYAKNRRDDFVLLTPR